MKGAVRRVSPHDTEEGVVAFMSSAATCVSRAYSATPVLHATHFKVACSNGAELPTLDLQNVAAALLGEQEEVVGRVECGVRPPRDHAAAVVGVHLHRRVVDNNALRGDSERGGAGNSGQKEG